MEYVFLKWMRGHDNNTDYLSPDYVNILPLHQLLFLGAEAAHCLRGREETNLESDNSSRPPTN